MKFYGPTIIGPSGGIEVRERILINETVVSTAVATVDITDLSHRDHASGGTFVKYEVVLLDWVHSSDG